MTPADLRAQPHLRAHIRELVNQKKRAGLAIAKGARYCIGCGGHQDEHTRGCQPCGERHAMRRRRAAR